MIHSLSKLSTFEKCAAKYKYQYVDKLPRTTGYAAGRGIDLHKAVEDYINDVLPALPDTVDFYTGFLDGIKRIPGVVPEAKLALRADWTATSWEADDVWWRGVLDLLIPPRDGTVHVYDWKTGKIYDDHEDQRQIYAIAAAALYPEATQVCCSHVYLDLKENRARTYHRDQLHGFRERWGNRFYALEKAVDFPHNPSYSCRWCSFSKAQGGPCPF